MVPKTPNFMHISYQQYLIYLSLHLGSPKTLGLIPLCGCFVKVHSPTGSITPTSPTPAVEPALNRKLLGLVARKQIYYNHKNLGTYIVKDNSVFYYVLL